jgi:Leucine-rich repeat (LRR) protein
MERNVKISFETFTIDWTHGNVCCYGIRASKGCTFFVDWGDGKTTKHTGQKDGNALQHDYNPRVIIPKDERVYYVKIFSEDEKCLFTGLEIPHFDMKFNNLDVSRCAELEYLNCGGNGFETLDVSRNPALIELDCGGNKLTGLDLRKNEALQILDCENNGLTTLDLRKNEALQVFKCEGNGLTNLMLGNQSDLRLVQLEYGNKIKEPLKRWIEKMIAENKVLDEDGDRIEESRKIWVAMVI